MNISLSKYDIFSKYSSHTRIEHFVLKIIRLRHNWEKATNWDISGFAAGWAHVVQEEKKMTKQRATDLNKSLAIPLLERKENRRKFKLQNT